MIVIDETGVSFGHGLFCHERLSQGEIRWFVMNLRRRFDMRTKMRVEEQIRLRDMVVSVAEYLHGVEGAKVDDCILHALLDNSGHPYCNRVRRLFCDEFRRAFDDFKQWQASPEYLLEFAAA